MSALHRCLLVFLFLTDQIFYRSYVNRQPFRLWSFALSIMFNFYRKDALQRHLTTHQPAVLLGDSAACQTDATVDLQPPTPPPPPPPIPPKELGFASAWGLGLEPGPEWVSWVILGLTRGEQGDLGTPKGRPGGRWVLGSS